MQLRSSSLSTIIDVRAQARVGPGLVTLLVTPQFCIDK